MNFFYCNTDSLLCRLNLWLFLKNIFPFSNLMNTVARVTIRYETVGDSHRTPVMESLEAVHVTERKVGKPCEEILHEAIIG